MADSQPIITYCIEYAETQLSKCADCQKVIPRNSLRVGQVFRKNKSEKKRNAKHTWWHFKCWEVPELVTKIPIEYFRGYPSIQEKDQKRVQRVIKAGKGTSWMKLTAKNKEAEKAAEQAEEGAEPADQNEQKKKKKSKAKDEEIKDVDMTDALTGVQTSKKPETEQKETAKKEKAPAKSPKSKVVKATSEKKELKPKTNEKNKVTKKTSKVQKETAPVKNITLPQADQLELQNIASEIQASLKNEAKNKKKKSA
ncbi:uncharacterized protein BYT42DRAFT_611690 [Radiomyces spectabilis]|uniref:uncharacterized protein n=1 Tax=Radiomyces spectabilis TaxID=64574 RepID=UPI002220BE3C|nr:uncharacterized protein BYT42DRAFT_611690 [Radiomyces spectabilis]KAI8388676.1 hypothetical protein BYT42DRAFT_611690 [Radiomyces spectabilis]